MADMTWIVEDLRSKRADLDRQKTSFTTLRDAKQAELTGATTQLAAVQTKIDAIDGALALLAKAPA